MAHVILLDCTLRDGGYINHWNFGCDTIRTICSKLIESNLDIIEVGFLTNSVHTMDDALYSHVSEISSIIPVEKGKSKIAVMIALGEMELDPCELPPASETVIDIIRITFHNYHLEQQRAVKYAEELMSKGYKVCMQPVGTTSYSDSELLQLIEKMNSLQPYAFYLVDTLGVLYKQDLLRLLYLIDHNLNSNIFIGFHSHNNIQMSFANTQEIVEFNSTRKFIIDSSIYGMGRGAGNLCTEIAAEFLNRTVDAQYNIFPMMEVVDECLIPIYLRNPWGYSAGYFLSSIRSCHPNYSSYLLSKQTLRVRDIGVILNQIPLSSRHVFDKNLIKNLYLIFQENEINDIAEREKLSSACRGRKLLLIAPGKSIHRQHNKILDFISCERPYTIAVNFQPKIPTDLIFISNRKRFHTLHMEKSEILFTSNVKTRPKNSRTVNYSSLLNSNDFIYDNAGLMLIELLRQIGIVEITLAGFDGFVYNQSENYYDQTQMGFMEQEHLERINQSMENELCKMGRLMELTFLTETNYQMKK